MTAPESTYSDPTISFLTLSNTAVKRLDTLSSEPMVKMGFSREIRSADLFSMLTEPLNPTQLSVHPVCLSGL